MNHRIPATLLSLSMIASPAFASEDILDNVSDAVSGGSSMTTEQKKLHTAMVPFAFRSDNMDNVIGATGVVHGLGPTSASLVLLGSYSSNDSVIASAGLFNTGFRMESPWRFDIILAEADFDQSRSYVDGNTAFEGQAPAGSNDSDSSNYVMREMRMRDYSFRTKWLAPLGDGAKGWPSSRQGNLFGLPVDDGIDRSAWNPFKSGRTILETDFFYRNRDVKTAFTEGGPKEFTSQGIKATLDYDNRNGYGSPSSGSRTKLSVSRDWGGGKNSSSFTKVEMDYSQYFNLGASNLFSQQVLAVNGYASDITTWDKDNPDNNPAWFAQSRLGGWKRMRGYRGARYHDRSAVNYSAELRGVTQNNFIGNTFMGDYYNIPWSQVILFGETGRVADEWNMSTLHEDMQKTFGAGLRFMIDGITIRTDIARSNDGTQVWVFVDQAF